MEYREGREKNIEKERFDISMVNRRINGFFFFSFFLEKYINEMERLIKSAIMVKRFCSLQRQANWNHVLHKRILFKVDKILFATRLLVKHSDIGARGWKSN